jgi:hypothetical protein
LQENAPTLRQGSYTGMSGNSLEYANDSDAIAAQQQLKELGITGLGVTTTAAREQQSLKTAQTVLPKIAASAAKHGINLIAHSDPKQGVIFGSPQTVFNEKGIPAGTQLGSVSFQGADAGGVGSILSSVATAARDNPSVASASNDQFVGPVMAKVDELKQSGEIIQAKESGRLIENPFVMSKDGKLSSVHNFTVGLNQLTDAIGDNSAMPAVSAPSPVEAARLFLSSNVNVTSDPKAVNALAGYLRAGVDQSGKLPPEVSSRIAGFFSDGVVPITSEGWQLILGGGGKGAVLSALQPGDAQRVRETIRARTGQKIPEPAGK